MLYDPEKYKAPPAPSLAGFRAWLERQNPEETFIYLDCERCAVGQYLFSIGSHWDLTSFLKREPLDRFAAAAWHTGNSARTTFGAVLREIEHASAVAG